MAEKQKRVTVSLSGSLLEEVDQARGGLGRSEFIRVALVEKLELSDDLIAAPDRVGKGGRPTHKKKAVEYDFTKPVGEMIAEQKIKEKK